MNWVSERNTQIKLKCIIALQGFRIRLEKPFLQDIQTNRLVLNIVLLKIFILIMGN